MKKVLFTILLACILGLNIYTLAKVTTFTQKEQEKQEFVQKYTLKDKQILDAYIENGDHKLVIWSEDKKSKLIITVPKETWQVSIIGKVYHEEIH
jgi:hypothetical protein